MFEMQPIGIAETPFKQKFGIPRQSGLIDVQGQIILTPPFDSKDAIKGLEQVSHIWLSFLFHHNKSTTALTVRPPRLGGNEKVGVFATRSSFRPNRLGLTLVKLNRVCCDSGVKLEVSGIDLLDQTPILDIKPYLPYVDCNREAINAMAEQPPKTRYQVKWAVSAQQTFGKLVASSRYTERQLVLWIEQLIGLDPRPAYKTHEDQRVYWMQFDIFDIAWHQMGNDQAMIVSVKALKN